MQKMHKVVVSTALALGLSLGTVAVVSAPAEAAGCVSKQEYRKVKRNWTKTRVHDKFGTSGHREAIAHSGGYVSEVRTYRGCGSQYNVVSVAFDKEPGDVLRLSAKSAVWVG
jgi:hypothetical protein